MSSAMPSTARARLRAEGGAESWTKCSAKPRSIPLELHGEPTGRRAAAVASRPGPRRRAQRSCLRGGGLR
eukprot:9532843-Alexandrium_andersonii.AAC.1